MSELITTLDRELLGRIRTIKRNNLVRHDMQHQDNIYVVKSGTVVDIGGVVYFVEAVGTYIETTWEFKRKLKRPGEKITEWRMRNLIDGSVCYFEWSKDDDIEAYLTEKELSNDPGHYGVRSWKEFLKDDNLNSSLTLCVDGNVFKYCDEESWAAQYYGGKSESAFVRCYEFKSDRGDVGLTVELWGEQGTEGVSLWLSREISTIPVKLIAQDSI